MRFSAPIIAYFFSVNNICKIHPLNNININIYNYKPNHDKYRYGSKERKEWFEKLKKITNNNGYASFIYKNEKEATQTQRATDSLEDSFMLFEPDQIKYKFAKTQTKGDPRFDRYKGGMI